MAESLLGGQREEIGGHTFDVGLLDSKTGLKTYWKVARMISAMKSDQEGLGAVLAMAQDASIPDLYEDLVQTFGKVTLIDNKKFADVREEVFRGKFNLVQQWLEFAIRVNYTDFLA